MRARGTHRRAGRAFTLVELQVALMVTGIILAAVVSLSFALNAACLLYTSDAADE